MFYRIKNNEIYDYADFEYSNDCKFSALCTVKQFENNRDKYTIQDNVIKVITESDECLIKQDRFEKEFFQTSLGWIRRKVTMKDGSIKDFLADLLLPIKAGLEMGQNIEIITYKIPDFTQELNLSYMESLQEIKFATEEFVRECLVQTVKDFGLKAGGSNGI